MVDSPDTLDRAAGLLQHGHAAEAERIVREALTGNPSRAALWNLYGAAILAQGRPIEAVSAFERAVALDSADPEPRSNLSNILAAVGGSPRFRLDLAFLRLAEGPRHGWLPGRSEAMELQAVHDALVAALDAGVPASTLPWAAPLVLSRLAAHDTLERLGDFKAAGRSRAAAGERRTMLMQLPRAALTRDDRMELLHQHRLWGETAEAAAAAAPIHFPLRQEEKKIRLGFLSSDLRAHAVGTFVWPLFNHLDRSRFEVFAYSTFPGAPDALHQAIAERIDGYRHEPGATSRQIAQRIAFDSLDILFEIGGPTGSNPIEAMAYRLAPIQASWLGYPHSTGLSTIDYVLMDPSLAPRDPVLMLERPLLMPRSWIAMSETFFRENPPPALAPPSHRSGVVTFGTANAGYKYSPLCLDTWARILAEVPGSRFLFLRPEGAAPTFRARMHAAFAARDVAPDRIDFEMVWGEHLPSYARIDVALDTLPVTGGTSTCESLWMGVPVVSLVGEALYERLSYSILTNAGLADLAVGSIDDYIATAVALAADTERRSDLRRNLRARIKSGPLCDTEEFARDFYALVDSTVRAVAG